MSAVRHYDQGRLALFAMQLLPDIEHSTVAMHIVDCSYCRHELAQLQGDLAVYSHIVDMHSPPALVRERLLNQAHREKKFTSAERSESVSFQTPASRPEPVNRTERTDRTEHPKAPVAAPTFGYPAQKQRSAKRLGSIDQVTEPDEIDVTMIGTLFSRLFPWLGWAAAATLAIVAGNLYHQRDAQRLKITAQANTIDRLGADAAGARKLLDTITDASARQVTLVKAQGEPVPSMPYGRITYIAAKGALIFIASNLEPVETYKTYELWLIPADGRDPIPAGTFHPDSKGNANVILPPLPKGIEARSFGITVEDEGGSQTPTMPIILAGN